MPRITVASHAYLTELQLQVGRGQWGRFGYWPKPPDWETYGAPLMAASHGSKRHGRAVLVRLVKHLFGGYDIPTEVLDISAEHRIGSRIPLKLISMAIASIARKIARAESGAAEDVLVPPKKWTDAALGTVDLDGLKEQVDAYSTQLADVDLELEEISGVAEETEETARALTEARALLKSHRTRKPARGQRLSAARVLRLKRQSALHGPILRVIHERTLELYNERTALDGEMYRTQGDLARAEEAVTDVTRRITKADLGCFSCPIDGANCSATDWPKRLADLREMEEQTKERHADIKRALARLQSRMDTVVKCTSAIDEEVVEMLERPRKALRAYNTGMAAYRAWDKRATELRIETSRLRAEAVRDERHTVYEALVDRKNVLEAEIDRITTIISRAGALDYATKAIRYRREEEADKLVDIRANLPRYHEQMEYLSDFAWDVWADDRAVIEAAATEILDGTGVTASIIRPDYNKVSNVNLWVQGDKLTDTEIRAVNAIVAAYAAGKMAYRGQPLCALLALTSLSTERRNLVADNVRRLKDDGAIEDVMISWPKSVKLPDGYDQVDDTGRLIRRTSDEESTH